MSIPLIDHPAVSLLLSIEFIFGIIIVITHQYFKFDELDTIQPANEGAQSDPKNVERLQGLTELRASDFVTQRTYSRALYAFLAMSALVYYLTCLVPSSILEGWLATQNLPALQEGAGSFPYPIYVAAIYTGLSHPGIPVLSRLIVAQRRFIHRRVGIPDRVVEISDDFTNQILSAEEEDDGLRTRLRELVGDRWIARIKNYADTVFYREKMRRLGLSDGSGIVVSGTREELSRGIRAMVFVASLATARESGVETLSKLADDLEVKAPPLGPAERVIAPGALIALVNITILWILLPLPALLNEASSLSFLWPSDFAEAGRFLLEAAVPLFLGVGLTLYFRPPDRLIYSQQLPNFWFVCWKVLSRNAILLMVVAAADLLFSYLLLVSSYTEPQPIIASLGLNFFSQKLPQFMLHATVPVTLSFVIMTYGFCVVNGVGWRRLPMNILFLAVTIGAISALCAIFTISILGETSPEIHLEDCFDFVILTALTGIIVAIEGLLTAHFYYKGAGLGPSLGVDRRVGVTPGW